MYKSVVNLHVNEHNLITLALLPPIPSTGIPEPSNDTSNSGRPIVTSVLLLTEIVTCVILCVTIVATPSISMPF